MRTLLRYQHTLLFYLVLLIFLSLLVRAGKFNLGHLPPHARIHPAAVPDPDAGAR